MNLIRILFRLFSVFYGWGVFIRNAFYDSGFFKSYSVDSIVISVGNIVSGGSGKTPITLYLLKYFSNKGVKVAFLSRGYGRKTSGYYALKKNQTSETVGDEPLLIYNKSGKLPGAVCENRVLGARKLIAEEGIDVLILDDGFQHRRIKRDFSIVCLDGSRPFFKNHLLPFGSLRESPDALSRADFCIVNKTSSRDIMPDFEDKLGSFPLSFSKYQLGVLVPFWKKKQTEIITKNQKVILFSGIANPDYYKKIVEESGFEVVKEIVFRDHFEYKKEDFKEILDNFKHFSEKSEQPVFLLTTEKDYFRLKDASFLNKFKENPFFYVTIEIKWFDDGEEKLSKALNKLIDVRKTRRDPKIYP